MKIRLSYFTFKITTVIVNISAFIIQYNQTIVTEVSSIMDCEKSIKQLQVG